MKTAEAVHMKMKQKNNALRQISALFTGYETTGNLIICYIFSLRTAKEERIVEVRASFPRIIDRDELYRIEKDIAEAYDLRCVRILPSYPSELFHLITCPSFLRKRRD